MRLINSNPQQPADAPKEKNDGKRVVAKRGREAPKFDQDDLVEDNWVLSLQIWSYKLINQIESSAAGFEDTK